ncbi:AAA family ATPase [Nonomuraea sp. NPDC005650]|uniref:AAA family ATPase n=1 Tax=Nonomuraea sp. NPDC005650 TaxID=3157045 RepID=UPI0033A907D7
MTFFRTMSRALLIIGAGGVGKTSVGHVVSRLLSESGRTAAFVDLDGISQFGPPPPQWTSYDRLRQQNLAVLWTNFRAAGARFLVIAGQVDTRAARDGYAAALADCDLFVVRLVAPAETIRERIRRRAGQSAHTVADMPTEQDLLETAGLENVIVPNDRPIPETATTILTQWLHDHAERRNVSD